MLFNLFAMPVTSEGFGPIHKTVESAKELSSLDVTTVWIFISLVLFAYIVYMLKQGRTSDKAWQEIRMREALANQQLSSAVDNMSRDVSAIKIIMSIKQ